MKITYLASYKNSSWECELSQIDEYTDFIKCIIKGRGSYLETIISKEEKYPWIFFPDIEKGCILSNYDDHFWNYEKLTEIFGSYIDALTVVNGINKLRDLLNL